MEMRSRCKRVADSLGWVLLLLAALPAKGTVPDGAIEGFGKDLPLTQAVEGIVPSGLHVVIANEVDPATVLSWEGGASWKAVLRDALGKVGLVPKIGDGEVLVELAPPPPQEWDCRADGLPVVAAGGVHAGAGIRRAGPLATIRFAAL